jgi:hypothetical protein
VAAVIPPPSTAEAFNAVFESRDQEDPWAHGNSAERRPEEIIYSLHHYAETLEQAADEGMRWEVLLESSTNADGRIRHLDSQPRPKSMEEVVASFQPYMKPPPPQAFQPEPKVVDKKRAQKQAAKQQAKARRYQTTIEVVELTDAQGQKTYTASPSPIIQLPDEPEISAVEPTTAAQESQIQAARIRQPFLERMRRREQLNAQSQQSGLRERQVREPVRRFAFRKAPNVKNRKMLLISVKRQRKLKMKKHKYKKLMKRTRNLRRRQDRA